MAIKTPSKSKSGRRNEGILFRYRPRDTVAGVSRKTASRLAKTLGLSETQVIHLALAQLAGNVLPRYEPDAGPLTDEQLQAIRKLVPQGQMTVSGTLF